MTLYQESYKKFCEMTHPAIKVLILQYVFIMSLLRLKLYTYLI